MSKAKLPRLLQTCCPHIHPISSRGSSTLPAALLVICSFPHSHKGLRNSASTSLEIPSKLTASSYYHLSQIPSAHRSSLLPFPKIFNTEFRMMSEKYICSHPLPLTQRRLKSFSWPVQLGSKTKAFTTLSPRPDSPTMLPCLSSL